MFFHLKGRLEDYCCEIVWATPDAIVNMTSKHPSHITVFIQPIKYGRAYLCHLFSCVWHCFVVVPAQWFILSTDTFIQLPLTPLTLNFKWWVAVHVLRELISLKDFLSIETGVHRFWQVTSMSNLRDFEAHVGESFGSSIVFYSSNPLPPSLVFETMPSEVWVCTPTSLKCTFVPHFLPHPVKWCDLREANKCQRSAGLIVLVRLAGLG